METTPALHLGLGDRLLVPVWGCVSHARLCPCIQLLGLCHQPFPFCFAAHPSQPAAYCILFPPHRPASPAQHPCSQLLSTLQCPLSSPAPPLLQPPVPAWNTQYFFQISRDISALRGQGLSTEIRGTGALIHQLQMRLGTEIWGLAVHMCCPGCPDVLLSSCCCPVCPCCATCMSQACPKSSPSTQMWAAAPQPQSLCWHICSLAGSACELPHGLRTCIQGGDQGHQALVMTAWVLGDR